MQSTKRQQQTSLNNQVLQQLLLKTKDELHPCYKKHKNKLPPLLHSKDMFMLHLIQQQTSTNRDLQSHSGKSSEVGNLSGRPQCNNSHSISRLVERPPKFIFDRETTDKTTSRNVLSSPSGKSINYSQQKTIIKLSKDSEQHRQRERSFLRRDCSSFIPQSAASKYVQMSQRVERGSKGSQSPKKEVQSILRLETEPVKGSIHVLKPLSLEKRRPDIKDHRFRKSHSKKHIKTCTDDTLSKIQISKLVVPHQQHNFHTKRERKLKIAYSRPIQSSLALKKQYAPADNFKYFAIEEELEPWSNQYPLEYEFMHH